jgi:hypothetical protein
VAVVVPEAGGEWRGTGKEQVIRVPVGVETLLHIREGGVLYRCSNNEALCHRLLPHLRLKLRFRCWRRNRWFLLCRIHLKKSRPWI